MFLFIFILFSDGCFLCQRRATNTCLHQTYVSISLMCGRHVGGSTALEKRHREPGTAGKQAVKEQLSCARSMQLYIWKVQHVKDFKNFFLVTFVSCNYDKLRSQAARLAVHVREEM